ncbi:MULTISPECIES: hypothetical protein [Klebsiella]|uniref:hypothetical protein n=1 Tax=Klebsiella TaxID=570 RepID=UPI0015F2AF1C|nr:MULTISPECIES: hypothetical protein [Klebsiella]
MLVNYSSEKFSDAIILLWYGVIVTDFTDSVFIRFILVFILAIIWGISIKKAPS